MPAGRAPAFVGLPWVDVRKPVAMPVPVTPTEARPAPAREVGLRRLRRLCIAVALACLGALPFELGMLPPPNPAAAPLVGRFFGRPTATATPRAAPRPTAPAPSPIATAPPAIATAPGPTAIVPATIVIHNYPR